MQTVGGIRADLINSKISTVAEWAIQKDSCGRVGIIFENLVLDMNSAKYIAKKVG